ncbi:MAG: dTMP kinase [Gloeocapsa sp. UFS-A4-WI-NPMV-4B04]|nr:dTMP kinase [Gloeocapsa sp. UFS-A4-WI-NPMV-4B04]
MNGRLIVFEGVEGCGKTTQLQRSQEWLQSLFVAKSLSGSLVTTREPGGTQLGLGLRELLLNAEVRNGGADATKEEMKFSQPGPLTELLLYAADRAQHVEEVLKPQLAAGAIILCDRYTNSTIAYQGYGRGFSLDLIDQLNFIATGGLESDLTLWLDVDVEVGLERTKTRGVVDRIEQAGLEFHERVQQGYTQLAKAQPQQIVRIDANLSAAAVQEQIQQILVQRLTEWGLG